MDSRNKQCTNNLIKCTPQRSPSQGVCTGTDEVAPTDAGLSHLVYEFKPRTFVLLVFMARDIDETWSRINFKSISMIETQNF